MTQSSQMHSTHSMEFAVFKSSCPSKTTVHVSLQLKAALNQQLLSHPLWNEAKINFLVSFYVLISLSWNDNFWIELRPLITREVRYLTLFYTGWRGFTNLVDDLSWRLSGRSKYADISWLFLSIFSKSLFFKKQTLLIIIQWSA